MATILNLETATTNCSVSISRNGEVAFLREIAEQGYSHAENLHRFIREGMEALDMGYNDLDAIAVSMGPGSYTGLRIGVSAAKGLCFAGDIPLIALATLEVLSKQYMQEDGHTVAMLDARRMEVYSAVFDAEGRQVRDTRAEVIDSDSFAEELERGKLYFVGNANEKCKEVITHPNACFIDSVTLPSAKEMAVLAEAYYQQEKFEDVAYFEPFYLKDFVVTRMKK
ncbi:tRNA (adenosine(37)-N6)-threonylcarbamoyltransferase complex dimerization subunit type 1 TsaB [Robertkochia sediminum]|uniref:tRNA (adenosine(37)-N6)-threonylcarbamoyltransferase complex dimerization subunit type 1 TsaB n=1 Tax=Robertkochia sediminum TaxID=2785326 RepID=UPI001932583B|nr:tRNA (adenosine(37)-N6)-threonylcarbamoyltransferase complex dimerization subunit type 1 TsaB [Robertkochia sediminum]MBL7472003.1 tRNA (adenosine(37)-N6)-threonylcarbamoyltransferase complex dimerization subunit type 1 TsaB [Robertkochia sediminum]